MPMAGWGTTPALLLAAVGLMFLLAGNFLLVRRLRHVEHRIADLEQSVGLPSPFSESGPDA